MVVLALAALLRSLGVLRPRLGLWVLVCSFLRSLQDFQLGQRLDIRDLQDQSAHAGIAAAGPVRRLWQARQAIAHQLRLECPQAISCGAARALVLKWALAGVRLAHPLLADFVLACELPGGHPPVVEVNQVIGIDSGDEFAGPGGVGAGPGGGGGVEEVGAHGRDCTGFFGFGWVVGGGVVSSFS